MTILVTGAAGFIGMHSILRLLVRGERLGAFDLVGIVIDVRVEILDRWLGHERHIGARPSNSHFQHAAWRL